MINYFRLQGSDFSDQRKERRKELFHLAFSCIGRFTKQLLELVIVIRFIASKPLILPQ